MHLNNKQKHCRCMCWRIQICFVDVVVVQLSHQDGVLGVNVLKKEQICSDLYASFAPYWHFYLMFTQIWAEFHISRWRGRWSQRQKLQFDCVSMFVSIKTPILNKTSQYIQPIQPFVLNETSGRFPAIFGARKNMFLMGSLDVSSCFLGDQFSNLGQNLIWTLTRPEHSVVKNLQLDQEEVLTYRWFIEMYINNMNRGD